MSFFFSFFFQRDVYFYIFCMSVIKIILLIDFRKEKKNVKRGVEENKIFCNFFKFILMLEVEVRKKYLLSIGCPPHFQNYYICINLLIQFFFITNKLTLLFCTLHVEFFFFFFGNQFVDIYSMI